MNKQQKFSLATNYQKRQLTVRGALRDALLAALGLPGPDVFDYPGPQPGPPEKEPAPWGHDTTATHPFKKTFAERKLAYLKFAASGDGNLMSAMCRLVLGQKPALDGADLQRRVDFVNSREDCADFELTRLMRALYLNRLHKGALFSPGQLAQVEKAVLDFKYWVDEPGHNKMISWTENHMLLFHSLEYLAGQYFPTATFTNNHQTGRWRMAHARPLILDWINKRARFGFSEWDSNVYFEEDLTPLLNLADFAEDKALHTQAAMAVDLMTMDMAFDHFYGMFPASKGRTYVEWNKWAWRHPLANVFKVLWGYGRFTDPTSFAAVLLVTGDHAPPPAIEALGMDMSLTYEHREQTGITLDFAMNTLGWNPADTDDLMRLMAIGAYGEPEVIDHVLAAIERHGLWEIDFVVEAKPLRPVAKFLPLAEISRRVPLELHRTYMGVANKLSYKTPDYMLCSAQDYHKGQAANQQMIWMASLAPDAIVHVNNPGALSDDERCPAYFGNDNRLPRVAQWRNVLASVYRINPVKMAGERAVFRFTHAYFPKAAFDEVFTEGNWTFARKGKGYLALYASRPTTWTTTGRDQDRELVAQGDRVVWLCHLGRQAEDGAFENFCQRIAHTPVRIEKDHNRVVYDAPGVGEIAFGWDDPFCVNGQSIPLEGYPHFENPFITAPRDTLVFKLKKDQHHLTLDFEKGQRRSNTKR